MRHLPVAAALALMLAATGTASAQPQPLLPPPPQPPRPAAAAPAPPPRARGVQVMTLDSQAWPDGGALPLLHSQAGRDVSPALSWSGAPEGVVSYALVMRDLDALTFATGEDALHWLIWNIPGTSTGLPAGVPHGNAAPPPPRFGGGPPPPPTDGPRQISATGPSYRGPAAPAAGPAHHYVFELFALDTWIDVPAVGQSPSATRAAVTLAMAGHVRGKGVRMATFRRPAP